MVRKSIRIYALYFAQFLKARLVYKWDFLASILAGALVSLSTVLFILVLMDGKAVVDLKGWTRDEILFIYGYSMLATGIFSVLSRNLYSFGDRYVIQGQFDRILLRPLNSLCQVIFESFNIEAIGTLLVGVCLLVYSKGQLQLEFSVVDILWLGVSALSGGVILLSVFIFLASLSFHFEDRIGIAPPFYNLIQFGRYPLTIFNRVLQFILMWIVPFGFVAFFPATHFFSKPGFEIYCYLTPLIAIVSATVASVAWQVGVGRYASTGS